MNPDDIGDQKDVEFDAECDCGWEGLMEAETWIPHFGWYSCITWTCPKCEKVQESEYKVEDLRW